MVSSQLMYNWPGTLRCGTEIVLREIERERNGAVKDTVPIVVIAHIPTCK